MKIFIYTSLFFINGYFAITTQNILSAFAAGFCFDIIINQIINS